MLLTYYRDPNHQPPQGQTAEGFGGVIVRGEAGKGLVYQLELPVGLAARAEEVYAEMRSSFDDAGGAHVDVRA